MTSTARAPRGTHETNVSTEQPETEAHARIPGAYGHPGRAGGAQAPAGKGPQAADGNDSGQTAEPASQLSDARLTRARRVRKRREFLRLQQRGRLRGRGRFVVITEDKRSGESRIGITTSRRVGNAVTRNRIKRMVREFFRTHRSLLETPQDILVIARPQAATATYEQVVRELCATLRIHAIS